ncbi:2685_t:CDS:2, partial [Scutellospora calospora]
PCTLEDAKQLAYNRRELVFLNIILIIAQLYYGCVIKSIDEKLCHEILTEYLGPPSLILKPNFLKTPECPTGLELDIYYSEYGFAIVQHEKYIKFFHNRDPNNFIKQQARDQLKKELCKENQIALKYVWYYEDPFVVISEHLREL